MIDPSKRKRFQRVVGCYLRRMRQSAGYSRKRVMQSASINRRKLRGYESGQFPIPLNVVGRLIAIYQVNPNDVQTVFYSAVKIFSSDE